MFFQPNKCSSGAQQISTNVQFISTAIYYYKPITAKRNFHVYIARKNTIWICGPSCNPIIHKIKETLTRRHAEYCIFDKLTRINKCWISNIKWTICMILRKFPQVWLFSARVQFHPQLRSQRSHTESTYCACLAATANEAAQVNEMTNS